MRASVLGCAALVLGLGALACGEATIGEPRSNPGELTPTPDGGPPPGTPGGPDAAEPATPPPAPDAAVPVAAPEERCTERYGSVPLFELCTVTEDTCTFIAATPQTSCGQFCAGLGGACLSAVDNKVGSCTNLESNPTANCNTVGKIDLLCTCTLPP